MTNLKNQKIIRVGISWKSKDNILGNLKSLSISDFIPSLRKIDQLLICNMGIKKIYIK